MAHEIYSQTQNMARELGLQLNDNQRLLLADAFAHAFIEGGKKDSHLPKTAGEYLAQREQGVDVVSTPGSDSDFTGILMDRRTELRGIVDFLKTTLVNSGTNGFALGLSGGIDSAVCAALAKRAIDELNGLSATPQYMLDLIILPMGNIAADADAAIEVANNIGAAVRTINLGKALEEFISESEDARIGTDKSTGNVKARLRMTAIYHAANQKNLLVLGTDNLSETYTGYFTKHGDGAADVFPISGYTKRQVYILGAELGLPSTVLTRAPSAGLWEGQTDEEELGIPYNFIDNRLEGQESQNVLDYPITYAELAAKLDTQHKVTEHKRDAPHIYIRAK